MYTQSPACVVCFQFRASPEKGWQGDRTPIDTKGKEGDVLDQCFSQTRVLKLGLHSAGTTSSPVHFAVAMLENIN